MKTNKHFKKIVKNYSERNDVPMKKLIAGFMSAMLVFGCVPVLNASAEEVEDVVFAPSDFDSEQAL